MATVSGGRFVGPSQAEVKQEELQRYAQAMQNAQTAIGSFMKLRESKRQFDLATEEKKRQFDLTLEENKRQFDLAAAMDVVEMHRQAHGSHARAALSAPDVYQNLLEMTMGSEEARTLVEGLQKGIYQSEPFNNLMMEVLNSGALDITQGGGSFPGGRTAQPGESYVDMLRERRVDEMGRETPARQPPASWQPISDVQAPSQAKRTLPEQRPTETEVRRIPGGTIPGETIPPIQGLPSKGPGTTIPPGEKLVEVPGKEYAAEATMPVAKMETLSDGRVAYTRMEEQEMEENVVADYMIQHLQVNPYENPQDAKLVARWMAEHNPEMELPPDLDEKGLAALRNTPSSRYRYEVPKSMEQVRKWEEAKEAIRTVAPKKISSSEDADLTKEDVTNLSSRLRVSEYRFKKFLTSRSDKTPSGRDVARRLEVVVNEEIARGMMPNVDPSFAVEIVNRTAQVLRDQIAAQDWKTKEDVVRALFTPEAVVEGEKRAIDLMNAQTARLQAETAAAESALTREYFPQILETRRKEIEANLKGIDARLIEAGIRMDIALLEKERQEIMATAMEQGMLTPELVSLYKTVLGAYDTRVEALTGKFGGRRKIDKALEDPESDLFRLKQMKDGIEANVYRLLVGNINPMSSPTPGEGGGETLSDLGKSLEQRFGLE